MNVFDNPEFQPALTKAFIRPSLNEDSTHGMPDSIVLVTTNGPVTVDEQILARFPGNASGRDIRTEALETWGITELEWGKILWTRS